ncbi:MAG: hypothetical protein JWQ70_805 [Aeromicrobium sp.]|nr:hypothetical protein [Aeromicrobium sp.]
MWRGVFLRGSVVITEGLVGLPGTVGPLMRAEETSG